MKKIRNIIYMLAAAVTMLLPSSCSLSEFEDPVFGEGESEVSFDVSFRPLDATGVGTRAAGDAVKHINTLWVVVYRSDGTHYLTSQITGFTQSEQNTSGTSVPAPSGSSGFAESKYCRAKFNMTLPLGKYRIYAVANHDLTGFKGTEDALKNRSLTWNASDISANNAMFGYFTADASDAPTSFDAKDVIVNKSSTSLHAWVRRAASKVTVSFDGSNLNENVYIYIHTVRIMDIPKTCLLGASNTPDASDELTDGETVWHRASTSTVATDGLRITKGVPTGGQNVTDAEGGVHHEAAANSLFFFENRQGDTQTEKGKYQDADGDGVIDHPDGNDPDDADFKDGVPYGTYVEVKGYYVNKTADNASQGPIVYRFMLGKDTKKNCDAERNNHYKLVLCFNKDANNVDWHIDYKPENPEISVPSPMYISYLHGETLNIPVVIKGGKVANFYAEITDNHWYYDGHKRIAAVNDKDYNGFLTFKNTGNSSEVAAADRQKDFENNKRKTFTATSVDGVNEYHYNVPVYTREVYLGQGFSGNNAYTHKERAAEVTFYVRFEGETDYRSKTIQVIQVKRAVNPTGVWREWNSDKSFNVVLMESDANTASGESAFEEPGWPFRPTVSDGPWTARIIQGRDWVRISKDGESWGTEDVTGSTDTEVDFHYKPDGTCSSVKETRCGVIQITYHNNTCIHYVFVTQGTAPVQMGANGPKWHTRNLEYRGKEVDTPLHEGSLFRFRNTNAAILAENNYRQNYGPNIPLTRFNSVSYYGEDRNKLWVRQVGYADIQESNWPIAGTGKENALGVNESDYPLGINHKDYNFEGNVLDKNSQMASVSQWNALKSLPRYYGILYGEESTETKTATTDAYEFPFTGKVITSKNPAYDKDKGMRGMFVWDRNATGGHLFFPIGATGHGHRAQFPDWGETSPVTGAASWTDIGSLRYANMSVPLADVKRPLLYDLYEAWGAIYWCRDWVDNNGDDDINMSGNAAEGGQNAMDINYFTYDFNTYDEHATWRYLGNGRGWATYTQSSDACLIRCVDR